jgi:uncharacterized membrane protein
MLHITAAFFLVGGSVAAGIFNALSLRAERPSETAYLLRLVRITLPIIYIGVAGTLIFGLWLWHELDFGLGELWIWASLVLWIATNALGAIGGRHQEHVRKVAEELASSGDASTPEFQALLRDPKGNAMSWLAGAAVIGILILMIWRPGA